MDLLGDILRVEWPVLLAVILATIVHELGHAGMALLVGARVRVVSIGSWKSVLRVRIGNVWFVLRAIPLGGYVATLPEPPSRRTAKIGTLLGGVLGNALAFAMLWVVSLAWPDLGDGLQPLWLMQLLFIPAALLPINIRQNGRKLASDGLQLWRLLAGPGSQDLATRHAALLRRILPQGQAIPALSEDTPEIVYQLGRRDRLTETWALRDACDFLRRVLARGRLPAAERGLVLGFLVSNELLLGQTGTSLECLDLWSVELMEFIDTPRSRVLRGGTLVALGRHEEAKAWLAGLLEAAIMSGEGRLCCTFMAKAALRLGDVAGAEELLDQGRALAGT